MFTTSPRANVYHFHSRHGIVSHVKKRHVAKKEFNCDLCDYGAVDEKLLRQHVEAVHLKVSIKIRRRCS
jgi:hypothetical protein